MIIRNTLLSLRRLMGASGSLRRQLVRGGAGSALIQVVNRLLLLALGVVLARGLGADGYGIYAYAFALMSLLMVFAELGMSTLLLREVAASQALCDWSYLRGVVLRAVQIAFANAVVLAGIATIVLWLLGEEVSVEQNKTLTWAIALLPFAVATRVVLAALQGLHHVVKAQAVEMLFRPVLVLVGVAGAFALYPNMRLPQYAMLVQLFSIIIVLGAAAMLLFRCLPPSMQVATAQYHTRRWLASAMPLTLIGGANIINSQADILMLGFFQSPEDVGIYRVAVQASVLVAFGLQAANAVIAPQFSRLYAQGEYERLQHLVTVSARVILLVAMPIALTFIFAGGVIAGWVFGDEFTQSHTPMAILAVGQLVNAAMGSVGFLLNMTGHERDVARTLLISACLNIVLNVFLIQLFGMVGAASATAISLTLWNVLLYKIVKKRMGINPSALSF